MSMLFRRGTPWRLYRQQPLQAFIEHRGRVEQGRDLFEGLLVDDEKHFVQGVFHVPMVAPKGASCQGRCAFVRCSEIAVPGQRQAVCFDKGI